MPRGEETAMTNVEIVRTFYDSVAGGDLEGALALLTDDCAWTEMDGFPYAGTHTGPDEVRENVFARFPAEWDSFDLEVEEILDAGDSVVGIGTYSGTYAATGRSMRARVAHVWRLAGGKVVSFEQFTDTLRVGEAVAG
jgi:ketosteroid isomerase-like protein